MSQACILIVDDDSEIRELIALYLQGYDFNTIEAKDGEEAIQQFQNDQPSLILLDVTMPGIDGFTVCHQIRAESTVPIIFLTSKGDADDVVKGLELGGDDYVTKPFKPEVLVARVKSNLRRVTFHETDDVLAFGELEINRHTFEICFRGENIPFLAKEMKLLIFLAERPKQVFHAEQLYQQVWNAADGDARTVMVHISNIRRKLTAYSVDSIKIETLKGVGYRFIPYS